MVTYWHLGPSLHYHMGWGGGLYTYSTTLPKKNRWVSFSDSWDLGFGSCSGSPGRLVLGLGAWGVGFGWGGPVEP